MAVTRMGAALTEHYRLEQLAVRAVVLRNLQRLWPMFKPEDFATFDAFSALAANLVQTGNQLSAQLAARYLIAFRTVEGQPDSIAPIIARPPALEIVQRELRATGLMGVLNSLRSGSTPEKAAENGWVREAGSATSMVLRGGRDTVTETTKADPYCLGWERIASGDACAFCAMLCSRGPVYREQTVDFEAHDHCACEAEPVYAGSQPSPSSERYATVWEQSTAGVPSDEALGAFRQALAGGGEDVATE